MAPSRRKRPKNAAASRKWNVGELVLAKVKGYQAWPAIVSEPKTWGYPAGLKKVLVCFFGTQEIALCNPAELEDFTEEKKLTLLGKRQSSAFSHALNEIIDSFDKLKKQDQVSDDELFGETDTTVENISGYSSTKSFKGEGGPISVEQLSAGVTDCLESITETVVAAPLTDALLDEVMQLKEAHGDLSSTERHVYPTSSKADTTKSGKCNRKRTYSRSLRSSSRVDTHSSDECSTVDLGCESVEREPFDEYIEEQIGLSSRVDFQTNSRAIKTKRKANQQTLDTSLVVSEHEMPKRDCEIHNESATLNRCSQSHQGGDEHLPLAKRARIRMGPHAGDEVVASVHSVHEDEKMVDINGSTNTLSDGALSFKLADMERLRDLSKTLPVRHEVETLVHEQEEPKVAEGFGLPGPFISNADAPVDEASSIKLGAGEASISQIPVRNPQSVVSRNGFTDGESSLPLSKRIHRALEAMSANVAEAGDGAFSCSPSTLSKHPTESDEDQHSIPESPNALDHLGSSTTCLKSADNSFNSGLIQEVAAGSDPNASHMISELILAEETAADKLAVTCMSTDISDSAFDDESHDDQHLKRDSPKTLDHVGSSTTCSKSSDNSFKMQHIQEASSGSDPNASHTISDSILAEETVSNSLAVKCTSIDILDSAIDDRSHGDQHLEPDSPKTLHQLGISTTCLISADNNFKICNMQEAASGSDCNVSHTISDSILAEETAVDSLAVTCSSIDILDSATDDKNHEDQHLKPDSSEMLDHLGSSTTCLISAGYSKIVHMQEAASEADPNVPHEISDTIFAEETAADTLDSAVDDESHADQHLKPDSSKTLDHLGSSTTCLISADNSVEMQEAASGSDPNVSHRISDLILAEEIAADSAVKCSPLDILDSAVDEKSHEDRHLKPDSPKLLDHLGSSTTCLIPADNSFKIVHMVEAASESDPNVPPKISDTNFTEETAADSLSAEKCTSTDILDSAVDAKNPMKQLLLHENNLDCQRSEFVEQAARPASPDSNGVPSEATEKLSATKNCRHPCPSPSVSDNNLADVQDTIALISPPSSSLSSSKVESFEDLIRSLTRSKETIGRATRIAIDCAKYGFASKVVEILAHSLEKESRLPKKVDLFFLVDSIAQCSRCLKGDCGIYPTIIQPLLPRLLQAAAPPGLRSYENQRQCLKVLRVWLERKILPELVIRPHIEELDAFCALYRSGGSRRPFRNERAFYDPVREMEGILEDEYGSNSNIQFPGFRMPAMLSDADEGSDSDGDGFEAVTPEHNVESLDGDETTAEVRKRNLILEDVDGELEMEDVAPCSEFKITATSDNSVTNHYQIPFHSSDNHCGFPFTPHQFEAAPPPQPQHPPPAHQAQLPDFSHAVHKYEHYKRNPRESRWDQSDLPRNNTRSSDTAHRHSHWDHQDFEKEPRHFPDSSHDCSFGEPTVHFSDRASNHMHPVDDDFHRGHCKPTSSHQFSHSPEHRSQLRRDIQQPHPNRFRQRYAGNSGSSRDFERNRYAPPQRGTGEHWRPPSPSNHGHCYDGGSRMDQGPYPPSYPPSRPIASGNRRRVPPWLMNRIQVNPGGPVPVGNRGPNHWKSR